MIGIAIATRGFAISSGVDIATYGYSSFVSDNNVIMTFKNINVIIPDNISWQTGKFHNPEQNTTTYNENNDLNILSVNDDYIDRNSGEYVNLQRWGKGGIETRVLPTIDVHNGIKCAKFLLNTGQREYNYSAFAQFPNSGYFDIKDFTIESKLLDTSNWWEYISEFIGGINNRCVGDWYFQFDSNNFINVQLECLDWTGVETWRWMYNYTINGIYYSNVDMEISPITYPTLIRFERSGNSNKLYINDVLKYEDTHQYWDTGQLIYNNNLATYGGGQDGNSNYPVMWIDYNHIMGKKYFSSGYYLSPIIKFQNSFENLKIIKNVIGDIGTIQLKISDITPAGAKTGTVIDNNGVSIDYWDPDASWQAVWGAVKSVKDYITTNKSGIYFQFKLILNSYNERLNTPYIDKIVLNYGAYNKVKYGENFSSEKILSANPSPTNYMIGNDEIISTGVTSDGSLKQLGSLHSPKKRMIKYVNVSQDFRDDWYEIYTFTRSGTAINRKIKFYENEVIYPSIYIEGYLSMKWEISKNQNNRYDMVIEIKERQ
ncbi:hypothetical protein HY745_08370 [Candidatus Desantisbacteria bacterium]|nr:hypothetical protein [Candidatus Desantisbacteria bacterium]